MRNAQQLLQRRIDAQQDLDAIVYGGRALGGSADWAVGQQRRAREVASRLVGRDVSLDAFGWRLATAKADLRDALAIAREALKAAKAELTAVGTRRQLQLALAA